MWVSSEGGGASPFIDEPGWLFPLQLILLLLLLLTTQGFMLALSKRSGVTLALAVCSGWDCVWVAYDLAEIPGWKAEGRVDGGGGGR